MLKEEGQYMLARAGAHHLKEGILKDPRNRTYKENLTQARSSSEVKERTQDSFVE